MNMAQREALDAWITREPEDDSLAEQDFDSRCAKALNEFLEDGWLPNGDDPSVVDEAMIAESPEVLDELVSADTDEEILEVAKRIRSARLRIIEEMIEKQLKAA